MWQNQFIQLNHKIKKIMLLTNLKSVLKKLFIKMEIVNIIKSVAVNVLVIEQK